MSFRDQNSNSRSQALPSTEFIVSCFGEELERKGHLPAGQCVLVVEVSPLRKDHSDYALQVPPLHYKYLLKCHVEFCEFF